MYLNQLEVHIIEYFQLSVNIVGNPTFLWDIGKLCLGVKE